MASIRQFQSSNLSLPPSSSTVYFRCSALLWSTLHVHQKVSFWKQFQNSVSNRPIHANRPVAPAPLTPDLQASVVTSNLYSKYCMFGGFPGGSGIKGPPANTWDAASVPGMGRPPGEGTGSPLQYSCLENPMDRRAWRATVHGSQKSRTWLSD